MNGIYSISVTEWYVMALGDMHMADSHTFAQFRKLKATHKMQKLWFMKMTFIAWMLPLPAITTFCCIESQKLNHKAKREEWKGPMKPMEWLMKMLILRCEQPFILQTISFHLIRWQKDWRALIFMFQFHSFHCRCVLVGDAVFVVVSACVLVFFSRCHKIFRVHKVCCTSSSDTEKNGTHNAMNKMYGSETAMEYLIQFHDKINITCLCFMCHFMCQFNSIEWCHTHTDTILNCTSTTLTHTRQVSVVVFVCVWCCVLNLIRVSECEC